MSNHLKRNNIPVYISMIPLESFSRWKLNNRANNPSTSSRKNPGERGARGMQFIIHQRTGNEVKTRGRIYASRFKSLSVMIDKSTRDGKDERWANQRERKIRTNGVAIVSALIINPLGQRWPRTKGKLEFYIPAYTQTRRRTCAYTYSSSWHNYTHCTREARETAGSRELASRGN